MVLKQLSGALESGGLQARGCQEGRSGKRAAQGDSWIPV